MNRKDEHVSLALAQHDTQSTNEFDLVRFVHHALPGVNTSDVDLKREIMGKTWKMPFFINAMTGGSLKTEEINRQLATAARETGIAIASGSLSAYIKDPSTIESFRVLRQENQAGFVMANVNANASLDAVYRSIDLLQADALQIHINAVQETVMYEGDRVFSHWQDMICQTVEALKTNGIPVLVKEVGFGLSAQTLQQLHALGVQWADVSGCGGTNFARIENARRATGDFSNLYGWGQSAPACLAEALSLKNIPSLLASGGVCAPLDVVKSLALGARAVGVSAHFLHTLCKQGLPALIDEINVWKEQIRQLVTLLGCQNLADLNHTDLIFSGVLREYCELRGVDVKALANRKKTL